eukprot:287559_1
MLRAAGKLNKTTNKSAMRDLSGRRQRFVEQEKELTQWFEDQKTTKQMTEKEIQDDFRHIKQHGTLPEKRMCHRGIHCRYKHKCRFVHPDDPSQDKSNKSKPVTRLNLYTQTDEEMRNALLMGQLNANAMRKQNKEDKKQTKRLIPLFGDDEHENEAEETPVSIQTNTQKQISHESHAHGLKWIMREDCDFIICDVCCKQYKGPSFHCVDGCDFDVCNDCVVIDSSMVSKDVHLMEYNNKSSQMKEIEQKDQIGMNLRGFSRVVDRKRKRKERNLGLLGLENVGNCEKIDETNKKKVIEKSKGMVMNEMKGDIELSGVKDVDALKAHGMDKLKEELKLYGLKCGGTLQERAERLFLLKDKRLCELPKHVFALKKKKTKRPPRKKQRVA